MLEQRVAQYVALGVEAHQHLQVAAEAHRGTLHGSAEVLALSVLHIIYNIDELLAVDVLLHFHRVCHGEFVTHHDGLDAVGQSLLFLFTDGALGEMVHVGKDATHDDCYQRKYQHHIR